MLDEASALLSKHGAGIVGPAEAIVSSPAAVGKAWTRFGELAEQSSTLRRVHTDLTAATAGMDTAADCAVIRDDPRDNRPWGASYTVRHNVKARPWPTDARCLLGWQLTSGMRVWCPTGPERDARWREVLGKPVDPDAALGVTRDE